MQSGHNLAMTLILVGFSQLTSAIWQINDSGYLGLALHELGRILVKKSSSASFLQCFVQVISCQTLFSKKMLT
jgi:hypothetical protein